MGCEAHDSPDRPAYSPSRPDATVSGDSAIKVARFKDADGALNELRKLKERWDNRLSLKVTSLGKRYAEGRLSIICYARWNPEPGKLKSTAGCDINAYGAHPIAVVIHSAYPGKPVDANGWHEQLMFVDVVELADLPKRVVPSLVRAYLVKDHVYELGRGFCYQSQTRGLCYSVPRFVFGEVDPIVALADGTRDLAGDMVERHMQVMDRVSNYQGDLGWRRIRVVPEEVRSGLFLRVDPKAVEVCVKEGGQNSLQLVDVAFGPFDL